MSRALQKPRVPELKRVGPEGTVADLEQNTARAVEEVHAIKADLMRSTATVRASYTASFGECVLYDPTGTGGFTIALPRVSPSDAGKMIWLKEVGGSVTVLTVKPPNGITIDGSSSSLLLNTARLATRLYTDGKNWHKL